jgi:hypothetical protein
MAFCIDGGLRLWTSEVTYETVWLDEGLSPYYSAVWWYYPGDVANRIKTGEFDFDPAGVGGVVQAEYLAA